MTGAMGAWIAAYAAMTRGWGIGGPGGLTGAMGGLDSGFRRNDEGVGK